eukprot:8443424-Pyramimonas_sp.AAC.1
MAIEPLSAVPEKLFHLPLSTFRWMPIISRRPKHLKEARQRLRKSPTGLQPQGTPGRNKWHACPGSCTFEEKERGG